MKRTARASPATDGSGEATLRYDRNGIAEEEMVMHNGTPRGTQLTRRRMLQLTGASATAVATADLTGQGLIVSAASLRRL